MAHISVKNLTIEFDVYGSNSRSIKNLLFARATGGKVMAGARDVVSVRALNDVSMEIQEGDRVGLLGHNGSGKTTMLRALAGIYKPKSGSVDIDGRVGALLNPAAGIDPDATGFENIYLRGMMMGMSRREITSQIDDIAEFTELGEFLGLPMRTYSAGMYARLAFGVSTAAKHDILLLDEGIGAGDSSFQAKARERVDGLIARTPIILLASHSRELIKSYCNRIVEMQHGQVISDQELVRPQKQVEHQ